ncbi:MAG: translation initiation factor IF-2 [Flavobacteriales bacterium]|nr:translation initiation factor IF-2 [Flavobacteriales bacterium]|tara:strand:+ start:11263 stop:13938 length:2676 start_codon:yes stop_codon:yes gene_type:complete
MAGKPKRLSKVTKEFNLGLTTVVDYLQEKGFEVESNPNAKISPEMYDALSQEFQTEKKVKEKSNKIEVKKPIKETISIEEEKPEPPKEEEKVPEPVVEEKASFVEEKEPPKEESGGLKVLGKINLDEVKSDKNPSKTESKKEEPKQEAKSASQPKVEEKPKAAEKQEEPKAEKSKDDDFIKVKTEKIDGPKVLGKIELPVEKPKKKPVASSNDSAGDKKKRKRIRKGPVQQNGGNAQGGNRRGGNRGNKKREPKVELTEEQVKKQIQETLARLSGGKGKNKGAKQRRSKRDEHARRAAEQEAQAEIEKSILRVTEFVAASELASLMDVSVNEIISACMSLGHFVSINQRLDAEIIQMIAEEFGFEVEFATAEDTTTIVEEEDKSEDLKERAPIVTVMGHVDHGKTSLLDNIRKANIAEGEAGGITQHIGAYSVQVDTGQRITFLDTPGHEAFTAMRARGAKVTDIAIIIIAADDSIMPQTKEAINHAQAAEVPMIFAINKIDKPGANPDKIREELSQMNILVEDWGGKFQCQEISAKNGVGIDDLLEKVLLEAELMELKANPDRLAKGTIIESELDKGRGYISTLLVQSGTLEVGSILVAGCYSGRVKAMTNEHGQRVKIAGPSTPVQLLGLNGAPQAGDTFNAMNEEKEARDIASKRMQLQREQGIRATKHITLEEMGRRIAIGDFQELNVIVKGDVDGSIEALSDALLKLSTEQIQINIIHKSVGQISDSDVLLATASDAIIVGFQVRPSASARRLAEQEQIDIRLYSIIYQAIEELKDAMEGMLKPKIEEKVVANVEVRETFKISKVGTVAGCYVLDGTISRSSKIRIIRDGIVSWDGELAALKRFKDDVKEVKFGYECGLSLLNFNDVQVGDVLEAYEEVEVKQTLK